MGTRLAFLLLPAVMVLAVWLHRAIAGNRTLVWALCGTALLVPFLLPVSALGLRTVAVGYALVLCIRLADLFNERLDPSMMRSRLRIFLAVVLPHPSSVPDAAAARNLVRKNGLMRLLRCGFKTLCLACLLLFKPLWIANGASASLGLAFQIYFMASGLADLSSGLFMLAGVDAREIFNAPFLAQSPTDFWAHRWNLLVSEFLRRTFFLPLARNGAPVLGMLFVFLQSGVAHEYFVAGILGLENYAPFRMLAFFTAQGIAIVLLRSHPVFRRLSRALHRPGRIAVHYGWVLITSPLFSGPIAPILDAFDAFVAPYLGIISFR